MRDLDAHELLHPTYLSDLGLATETDRRPDAPFFGLTRDRVERYVIPRIDRAELAAVDEWFTRGDRARDPWGPCDRWVGPTRRGYPVAKLPRSTVSAHRLVFELERHPVPEGFVARPRCGQDPACVTPRHLALFRPNRSTGQLPRKQVRDLVHMVVRAIEARPDQLEWPEFERYAAVFGVSPHTVRYHVHGADAYTALRERRESARLAQQWR